LVAFLGWRGGGQWRGLALLSREWVRGGLIREECGGEDCQSG
jgi:hypothetical protein